MPNWVTNNLTITGEASEVQAVKARLAAPYERVYQKHGKDGVTSEIVTVEQDFSFWNIVRPEGEDRVKYDESLGAPGAAPFWYDWNCNNWGTKWDTDAELTEHADDHLQYQFDTAWAPPYGAMTALGKNFPTVHIELEWEEEQGFGGTYVFRNGDASETEYYDIPSSHADYVERDKTCMCEDYPDDPPFSDCPATPPSPDMLIADDEIIVEALV